MRSPRPFTQADITSAFKAAKAAGYETARVEVQLRDGNKLIAVGGPHVPADDDEKTDNPWDEVEQ